MSESPEPSCSRAFGGASFSDKPSYVRRLKFGQSILDTMEHQCHTLNCALVVDESVDRIPCTEKKEYVRKWIETHGAESDETRSGDRSQLSPVLGTSVTGVSTRSPILGNSSKRRKGKIRINNRATMKRVDSQDCWENGEQQSAMHFESDCRSDEENKTKHSSDTVQRTPFCTENAIADELSPVLGTCQHRKKKRKKLQCDDLLSTDMNPQREANNNCGSARDVSATGKLKACENTGAPYGITPIICQKYRTTLAPEEERLNLQDSSGSNTDRNNITIEMSSASEDSRDDEAYNKLSNTGSGNNSLSNFIDVGTQEATQVVQPSQLTANETYCSEAEVMLDQSIRLSAQISQVTSLNRTTQKTGDKLTQTDHVSTITTPSKKSPDRSMYACILDSGKKRRKPKKGSMVSKLQSLVNAQVSDIRIWRHQMNKEQDAAVQFVSVFVRSCRKQFGNQFLDAILLEDRFNLLQTNEEIEETKLRNTQVRLQQASNKNITIMLVCDIVGTLKMMSDVVINVYPPWTILDRNNLILEVTYISISDDNKVPDVANKNYLHKHKNPIVKKFNCPCIEEERELPFCSRKPSSDKPDVMEKIFGF